MKGEEISEFFSPFAHSLSLSLFLSHKGGLPVYAIRFLGQTSVIRVQI